MTRNIPRRSLLLTVEKPAPSRWANLRYLVLAYGLSVLGLAHANTASAADPLTVGIGEENLQQRTPRMQMAVGEHLYTITLDDTETARAFASLAPLTLTMADLNSNEKHADLMVSLPRNPKAPGMITAGDLMLYGSKTLVVFYKTFQTPYSYTRIGKIENPDGLVQVLGHGNVRIEFSRH